MQGHCPTTCASVMWWTYRGSQVNSLWLKNEMLGPYRKIVKKKKLLVRAMSVFPSDLTELLDSHWTYFLEICYMSYFLGGNLSRKFMFNPLNPELNPICYLLALLGAHHFLHVSRIRVKLLTFKRLIYIYIYMEHPFLMFLDHTQRRSTVGRTPLDE